MATNLSFLKLKGNLGGLNFYEAGGENRVREKGGVDRDRIMNDPDFKRTRENMCEFGGAAKVGKAFRMCFSEVIKMMSEPTLTGRVTGMMRKINSMGTGTRGKRMFDLVSYSDLLKGFEFNRNEPLSSIFYAPSDPVVFNANRDVVTWNVPVFKTDRLMLAPEGSTHFKLILAAGIVSNYVYVGDSGMYEPAEVALDCLHGLAESAEIPIGGMSPAAINLSVDLGVGLALPANVIVLAATGIIFYQQINSEYYLLARNNAMQVAAIG